VSDDLDFSPGTAERWTWSADEIRQVGHRVVELIAEHLTQIPDQPVFRPFPNDKAAAMLSESVPEQGTEVDAILRRFAKDVMPYPGRSRSSSPTRFGR
jgi:aromatic-L-amino-acid decarboxylase